jgi:dTDP-4-amino-4,6-dideoxygalactose transaminase
MIERSTYLPFAAPDLGSGELDEVRKVLESGWITTGPKAMAFEEAFADYVGARHAVAVNSWTGAMHLALEAAGLRAGDIVVTTPYTFAATAEVIRYFDAVPVFVDVERDTLNIDPERLVETLEALDRCLGGDSTPTLPAVARAVATRNGNGRPYGGAVKAVLPVHIAGHPCELDEIGAIAGSRGLTLIEDAAHACTAAYKTKKIGSRITATTPSTVCFSFYATKTLATGEGGMVTTDDAELAERMRIMSLHGISKDAWKRYAADGSWYYEITAPGFKYNMPDVLAAIGIGQLRRVDAMRARREDIARRYTEAFSRYGELETPTHRAHVEHAWHLYMLRLNPELFPLTRDDFINILKARHIGVSVHFIPLHLHPYYRQTYGYEPTDFPNAVAAYSREVSLPIYSRMTDFDVESVIDAVCATVEAYRARAYAGV